MISRSWSAAGVFAMLLLTTPAGAVTVTDFGGNTSDQGGVWNWVAGTKTLQTGGSNTSGDYLFQTSGTVLADITGGQTVSITGNLVSPGTGAGGFILHLNNGGTTIATGSFSFSQFLSGPVTVNSPLTFTGGPSNPFIDQWYIFGNGDPTDYFGEITFSEMTVAIPEPSTCTLALAALTCGVFCLRRRMPAPLSTTLRRMSGPLILACVVAMAGMATDGVAATIYEPTAWSFLVDTDVSPVVSQATQFHTTATEFILTGVSLQMRQDAAEPATGSLNWLIYTDNAGHPNLPVSGGLIFNQDVSALSSSYTTVSTGLFNLALSPSTDYWLVLEGQSLSSGVLQIQNAFGASGTGSPFAVASYTSTWAAQTGQATVGTMTAVPEPAVGGFAAVAVGLMAMIARGRRARVGSKARRNPAG